METVEASTENYTFEGEERSAIVLCVSGRKSILDVVLDGLLLVVAASGSSCESRYDGSLRVDVTGSWCNDGPQRIPIWLRIWR